MLIERRRRQKEIDDESEGPIGNREKMERLDEWSHKRRRNQLGPVPSFFFNRVISVEAKTKTDRAAISHFVTKTKTKTNRGNETLRRRLKRPGEVGVAPAAAAAAATTAAAEAAVGAAYDGLVTSWACRNEGSAPGHAHPAAATPTRPPWRPKWLPRRGLKSRILHHSTDGGSVVCFF